MNRDNDRSSTISDPRSNAIKIVPKKYESIEVQTDECVVDPN